MAAIVLKDIKKIFGKTEVLRGTSLVINEGEQVVISGASGSGKSTLLYIMGGLERPNSGDVIIFGKKLRDQSDDELALYRNNEVGFVFQFHFLLSSMNCLDNILLPAKIGGRKIAEIEKRCRALAMELGVDHCLEKYPFELSGGEQQRINLIRALSLKPKLLLCDEPTGNLDSKNSEKVTQLLQLLSKELGATLIVVTHDRKVASSFEKEFMMKDGLFLATS